MPLAAAAVVAGASYMASRSQKAPKQAAPLDIKSAAADAIQANISNTPYIEQLLRRANQFNQQQNLNMLEQAAPGYSDWSSTMTQNAQDWASGKLSTEQTRNLTRLAAERGISTGRSGQASQFSLLRDFGLTQFQQAAASSGVMQSIIGMSKVSPMSAASLWVNPTQAIGVAGQNQSMQQSYLNAQNAYQNQRAASPWNALASGVGVYAAMGGFVQNATKANGSTSGGSTAAVGGGSATGDYSNWFTNTGTTSGTTNKTYAGWF